MLTESRREAMVGAGFWPERTILDYLSDALADHPDQLYVTDHNTTTGRSTSLTYRQLDRLSRRIAAALTALGVERGDVVAVQLPNWWEVAAIHLACVRIGAITNPLQPIFLERELQFMLSFAQAKVFFVPRVFRGFEYVPMAERLHPSIPSLQRVVPIGSIEAPDSAPEGTFERDFLARRWEDEIDTVELEASAALGPNEVAEICYTSGTTGQPKGVMHTYNTLLACIGATHTLGFSEHSVILMASPLAHQTGFLFGLLLPLVHGARTVFQDVWDA